MKWIKGEYGEGWGCRIHADIFPVTRESKLLWEGKKEGGWVPANTHTHTHTYGTLWEPLTWAGMESATWRRRTHPKLSHTNPHSADSVNQKTQPWRRHYLANAKIDINRFWMEVAWWATDKKKCYFWLINCWTTFIFTCDQPFIPSVAIFKCHACNTSFLQMNNESFNYV